MTTGQGGAVTEPCALLVVTVEVDYYERPVSRNRVSTIMAFGVPYRVPVIVDAQSHRS